MIISKNYILHSEKKRAELEKKTASRERDEEKGVDELYTACGGEQVTAMILVAASLDDLS